MIQTVSSVEHAYQLIDSIKSKGSVYLSNFFADPAKMKKWIMGDLLFFEKMEHTILFFKKNKGFSNVFYFSNTDRVLEAAFESLRQKYSTDILVLDIINKEKDSTLASSLDKAGFEEYTSLMRMSRQVHALDYVEVTGSPNLLYANESYSDRILRLFNEHFDPYCEQIPSKEEIDEWILNNELIIFSHNDDIQGFIIFEQIGKTAYLRYWFVCPGHREKGIGSILINRFFSTCRSSIRQIFWVLETNQNAIKRYEHFGFKKESLFDYVYINRPWKYEGKNN